MPLQSFEYETDMKTMRDSGAERFGALPVPESDHANYQLPRYETEVDKIIELRTEVDPSPGIGAVVTSLAYMSDGSRNVLRRVFPSQQKFDRRVALTTPLATRVNGFNTYVAYELASQGMGVDVIGAPQKMGKHEHLSHEAHNFAQITSVLEDEPPLVAGMSRGGMEALGIISYMNALGKKVPLAIIQDPCLANGLGLQATRKDMTPQYVASEMAEGALGIAERAEEERLYDIGKHILRLGQTFSFSPKYLSTHVRIGRELWRGQAGSLASTIPSDAALVAHFYTGSRFNHVQEFERRLRDRENVRIVQQEGLHLTMTRKSVTKAYVGQFVLAQEMLANGEAPNDIVNALDYPLVRRKDHLRLVR